MTQMLLFDSPAATPVADTPVSGDSAEKSDLNSNIATQLHYDSGVNHMGDLARLVLMRYELVARRRAARAKKMGR